MTVTSKHEGLIAYDPAELVAQDAFDVSQSQALANNANHFADSCGQVLVDWAEDAAPLTPSVVTIDTWQPIESWGPFNLKVREDGSAFPIRVRVAARGGNTGANTIRVRVAVCAPGRERIEIVEGGDNVHEARATSSSSAWLTPFSGFSTLLNLSRAKTEGCMVGGPVLDGVGGSYVSQYFCEAVITVWGYTPSAQEPVQLVGLYCAEWTGQ